MRTVRTANVGPFDVEIEYCESRITGEDDFGESRRRTPESVNVNTYKHR